MTCCTELYFREVYKSRWAVNAIVANAACGDSGRMTRDSENAPLRATQAGSLLCVHHRRIDRSRLPVDSACPCRANRSASFRADHAAFSGGPFDISGPRVKEVGVTSSMPPAPAPLAESRSVQEWLRSCELHGGSFIDPCGLGALMPEEETGSPEEVRSQSKRCLPSVDE